MGGLDLVVKHWHCSGAGVSHIQLRDAGFAAQAGDVDLHEPPPEQV